MTTFRSYPNWNEVIRTPPVRWNADEPPESKYESFIDWGAENDHEEVCDLEDQAYHAPTREERDRAMSRLDDLCEEFLGRGFSEPEPSGSWDWSPVGW